ncbi:RNA-directed DNA polymerase, eukaryota, reverse transcriptase zinc-binding domain protein [Tanacetum coccineum]
MWSKFGLAEIYNTSNDVFYFKFRHEYGKKFVLESSPWMVGRRPLLVQKWSPDVDFKKAEPDKIPLWIKMYDVPLEAWTSKLGKGRIGYDRVLVEVDAGKEFKDFIKVKYRDKEGNVIRTKNVKVEYSWKPDMCEHCMVFGHKFHQCSKRPKSEEEKRKETKKLQDNMKETDMFVNKRSDKGISRMEYRPVNVDNVDKRQGKGKGIMGKNSSDTGETSKSSISSNPNKKSNNRFAVLNEDEEETELNSEQKKEVDFFVNLKLQPTPFETNKWTHSMVNYFKTRWERLTESEIVNDGCEDVLEEVTGIGKCMADNEVLVMEGCLQPTY